MNDPVEEMAQEVKEEMEESENRNVGTALAIGGKEKA